MWVLTQLRLRASITDSPGGGSYFAGAGDQEITVGPGEWAGGKDPQHLAVTVGHNNAPVVLVTRSVVTHRARPIPTGAYIDTITKGQVRGRERVCAFTQPH